MEVITASGAAVWMCPECGHGSADPRDERAHLDAHRQLRSFFAEWEAGTEKPVTGRPRRTGWLVRAGVVVAALVLLVVASSVFSRINTAPGPGPVQVAPVTAPPAPVTSPSAPVTSPSATVTPPPATVTSPPATAPRASASPKAAAAAPAATSPAPSPAEAPTTTVPNTSPAAPASAPAPAPPAHLVSLCLPGICLNVL